MTRTVTSICTSLRSNEAAPASAVTVQGGVLVTVIRTSVQAREAAFHDAITAAWNILPLRTARCTIRTACTPPACPRRSVHLSERRAERPRTLRVLPTGRAEEAQKILG